ncbi:glutathione S-transferase family protein [Zavarzinia compransoris]|uniref:Glutathione S-transferase n=1 Tax=Zavarzinia compransoris TaxID=1264899 RepID=A0A317EBS5_9PROT|nr:glutathione S-transferase family protein [Zavarzinia compransoris]PWR23706.1 glutathione S-transferase [Zavarzinia compransoris]TDP47929.1 glutathione S-transferase [Zavarzinia compransoris]
MILYGAILSPFVRKALLALKEKGLAFEHQMVMPGDKSPAFRALSPFGKIPAFADGDFKICDSTAIVTYLDAKYPETPVLPADPAERARAIWFEEFSDTIVGAQVGALFWNRVVAPRFMGQKGDDAAADKAEREGLPPILDYLETQIQANNLLVGQTVSIADLSLGAQFVNLAYAGVEVDAAKYPKLAGYLAVIQARPAFIEVLAAEKALMGG